MLDNTYPACAQKVKRRAIMQTIDDMELTLKLAGQRGSL